MPATLYGIPASHPCITAELILDRKGIPFRRTDLFPVISIAALRALGFPGGTVPALKLDGRRVQGSTRISRTLEEERPEPRLFPADQEARRRVEEAELWADAVLQDTARRIILRALLRDRDAPAMREILASGHVPVPLPLGLAARTAWPIIAGDARIHGGTDEAVRGDLARLPAVLDRLDAFIADGVMGGDEPNAADMQAAPSLAMLMTAEALRPHIEDRPCGRLAARLVPNYPGRVSRSALPAEWLAPLQAARPEPAAAPAS